MPLDDRMSTASPTPPSIPKVDGVLTMFYYADLAAAERWYEEVIGFEKVMRLDGLALFRVHASSHLALVGDGAGSQQPIAGTNKGAILSIQTSELQQWHQRLFAHQLPGTGRGLHIGCDGRTIEFKVRDPEGYTVEFFEWID